jgi:sRNA-binding carbon storage regulator CsrA
MLIVSRRDAESILIRPGEGIDTSMTLADLFQNGPIEITIFTSDNVRVKMGVQAPEQLSIWRKNNPVAA